MKFCRVIAVLHALDQLVVKSSARQFNNNPLRKSMKQKLIAAIVNDTASDIAASKFPYEMAKVGPGVSSEIGL